MEAIKLKTHKIYKLSGLVPGLANKAKFTFVCLWLSLRHRLMRNQKSGFRIPFYYEGVCFDFYSCYATDVSVLYEVFVERQYYIAHDLKPAIIFDLGANTGASAIFFGIRYPGSVIYAFEPDPEVFEVLKKNTQFLGARLFNIAVADADGLVDFFVHPQSNISSSMDKRFTEQVGTKVESRTLESLTKELKIDSIDLLKFDIEGAESKVFASFDENSVKYLIGEFHPDITGFSVQDFIGMLASYSTDVKLISGSRYIIFGCRKDVSLS